ncbi:MAG: DUF721 domain-containing protein [Bryobacteraceae bacterium]
MSARQFTTGKGSKRFQRNTSSAKFDALLGAEPTVTPNKSRATLLGSPDPDRMERAARLIKTNKLARQVFSNEDLLRAIWPQAVGKPIASHTAGLKLVRKTLVVEVEDSIWQRQLFPLSGQILSRLRKIAAGDLVERIEFRIGTPRRQVQRAEAPRPISVDEADAIRDPVLQKLYRLSRKKASA